MAVFTAAIAQHQWNQTGCNQVISGNARMRAEFSATQRTVTDSEVVGGDITGMQVRPFIRGLGVCFLAPPDLASSGRSISCGMLLR